MKRFGPLLLSLGLAGIGVLNLWHQDFALSWQPVPSDWPQRALLAQITGALLVVAALANLTGKAGRWPIAVLTLSVAAWLLVLQGPRVVHAPGDVVSWLGFGENALLVAGGGVLWLSQNSKPSRVALTALQLFFAASLPGIGISHFVYAEFTAGMVPTWLPWHLGIAYLTGVAHVAAGGAILLGILPRLAATLEALMITLFLVLLHLPGLLHEPASRLQWTMVAIVTSYAGGAWAVASSMPRQAWWKRAEG